MMHWQARLCTLAFLISSTLSSIVPQKQELMGHQQNEQGTIHHALRRAQIIPTVLKDFEPVCTLGITYASRHITVHYGNSINPSHASSAPAFEIDCPDLGEEHAHAANFTIALTDPDAPSRRKPKWSEMCHWLAVSEKGGQTSLVEYKPPGPPSGTGKHRYIFVLLRGDTTNLTAPSDREHWGFGKPGGKKGRRTHGVQDWADREGLEVIGANWFEAKNEKE